MSVCTHACAFSKNLDAAGGFLLSFSGMLHRENLGKTKQSYSVNMLMASMNTSQGAGSASLGRYALPQIRFGAQSQIAQSSQSPPAGEPLPCTPSCGQPWRNGLVATEPFFKTVLSVRAHFQFKKNAHSPRRPSSGSPSETAAAAVYIKTLGNKPSLATESSAELLKRHGGSSDQQLLPLMDAHDDPDK